MQNIKLLDLQTGKYLELGKDFLYGGDYIIINKCKIGYSIYKAIEHKDSEKFFKYDEECDKDCPFANELNLLLNEPLKTLCEKTGAVVYGGRYVLIECLGIVCNGDIVRDIQNAGIYCKIDDNILNINDYFINDNQIYSKNNMRQQYFYKSDFSNVLKNVRTDFEYALDFFNKKIDFEYATKREKKEIEGLIKSYMQNEPDKKLEIYYMRHKLHSGVFILGNIFEEYSKQLRNEPNKFEELMELIK